MSGDFQSYRFLPKSHWNAVVEEMREFVRVHGRPDRLTLMWRLPSFISWRYANNDFFVEFWVRIRIIL